MTHLAGGWFYRGAMDTHSITGNYRERRELPFLQPLATGIHRYQREIDYGTTAVCMGMRMGMDLLVYMYMIMRMCQNLSTVCR